MDRYVTCDTNDFWWIIIPSDDAVYDIIFGPYGSEEEALEDLYNV